MAREPTVITDTVKALWQDMHQEAADELVGVEPHQLVSLGTFDVVVLPLDGDAVVVERDQAPVGDGDAVDVAGEIAEHFLGATERPFAVDDPFAVAQRSQIGGQGSCIGQGGVLAEEL